MASASFLTRAMTPAWPATALLRLAMRGEQNAIHWLVNELAPVIRSTVRAELSKRGRARPSDSDLDDYTQEVWVRLWSRRAHKLRSYDASRGVSLAAFVSMITKRELIALLRKRGAKKRGARVERCAEPARMASVPDHGPSPEQEADTAADLAALCRWLRASLPARGVLVFRYVYSDGLSPQQTATAMGVSIQVVYNWQHKIRGAVRTYYARQAVP